MQFEIKNLLFRNDDGKIRPLIVGDVYDARKLATHMQVPMSGVFRLKVSEYPKDKYGLIIVSSWKNCDRYALWMGVTDGHIPSGSWFSNDSVDDITIPDVYMAVPDRISDNDLKAIIRECATQWQIVRPMLYPPKVTV